MPHYWYTLSIYATSNAQCTNKLYLIYINITFSMHSTLIHLTLPPSSHTPSYINPYRCHQISQCGRDDCSVLATSHWDGWWSNVHPYTLSYKPIATPYNTPYQHRPINPSYQHTLYHTLSSPSLLPLPFPFPSRWYISVDLWVELPDKLSAHSLEPMLHTRWTPRASSRYPQSNIPVK